MNFKEQLVQSRTHTWSGTNQKTTITVHETANTSRGAHAQAHANLQSNGNVRQASWHVQVDDAEAIRSFPDDVRCWHAGKDAQDSLSLEICVNEDGDYDRALANAAEVVKQWRAEHGLGRDDVVDHNYWTGKDCPAKLRASGEWDAFVASTDPDGDTSTPATSGGKSSGSANKSISELAREVIDGQHGHGAARQRNLGSRYQAVQAEVNRILSGGTASSGGSVSTVARKVINGEFGNEPQRSRRLRNAGHDPDAVQAEVNRIVTGRASSGPSLGTLAQQVIDGKWGNGADRARRLRNAGHDADAVQAEVNRRLA